MEEGEGIPTSLVLLVAITAYLSVYRPTDAPTKTSPSSLHHIPKSDMPVWTCAMLSSIPSCNVHLTPLSVFSFCPLSRRRNPRCCQPPPSPFRHTGKGGGATVDGRANSSGGNSRLISSFPGIRSVL